MTIGNIDENSISFRLDENLVLSISTKDDKDVFLNEEKLDKETTLENLFNSKIIPWLKKDYYVLSSTAAITSTRSLPKSPNMPPVLNRRVCKITASLPNSNFTLFMASCTD